MLVVKPRLINLLVGDDVLGVSLGPAKKLVLPPS